MKKTSGLLLLFAFLSCMLNAQQSFGPWIEYGDEVLDDYVRTLAELPGGGFLLAGFIYHPELEQSEAKVVLTDEYGEETYRFTYGTGMPSAIYGAMVDGGYFYLAGKMDGQLWVEKTDFNEATSAGEWSMTYGEGLAGDICQFEGYLYVGGTALLKINLSDGTKIWEAPVNWDAPVGGVDIVCTEFGLAVLGVLEYQQKLSLSMIGYDGIEEGTRIYGPFHLIFPSELLETADGFVIGSTRTDFSGDNLKGFVLWTDPGGYEVASQVYPGDFHKQLDAMSKTEDGGLIMAGLTEYMDNSVNVDNDELWVIKTDIQGSIQWSHSTQMGWSNPASAAIQTLDGGYVLGGYNGDVNGDRDMGLYLISPDELTPWFMASPRVVASNSPVQFTDASLGQGASTWEWDFGDGASSGEKNPIHSYSECIYSPSLTINTIPTFTRSDYVYVYPYVSPGSYCVGSSGDASSNWIASVQAGSQSNASGASTGG